MNDWPLYVIRSALIAAGAAALLAFLRGLDLVGVTDALLGPAEEDDILSPPNVVYVIVCGVCFLLVGVGSLVAVFGLIALYWR